MGQATRRVQAEVARIPFVLRIATVASALRKIREQVSPSFKLCVTTEAPLRIEGFPYSHDLEVGRPTRMQWHSATLY